MGRIQNFELWLEFEIWEDGVGDPFNDFFNMTILLEDGRKYALNVWTFDYLTYTKMECGKTGENLGGQYLSAPDLFVEKLERCLIENVVSELLAGNQLNEEWLVQDDES